DLAPPARDLRSLGPAEVGRSSRVYARSRPNIDRHAQAAGDAFTNSGEWQHWTSDGWIATWTGTDRRMVAKAIRPPRAEKPAAMSMASRQPFVRTDAGDVCRLTSAGSTATDSSPARRETALLTADPTPTWASSTAASTAAVSGATVIARPNPNTRAAGRMPVK